MLVPAIGTRPTSAMNAVRGAAKPPSSPAFVPAPTSYFKNLSIAGGVIPDEGTAGNRPMTVASVTLGTDAIFGPVVLRSGTSSSMTLAATVMASSTWSAIVPFKYGALALFGVLCKDAGSQDFSALVNGNFQFYQGAFAGPDPNVVIVPGTHVFGMTHTAGASTLYLNGSSIGSRNGVVPNTANIVNVCQDDAFGIGRRMTGSVGRVGIWEGTALTAGQHADAYSRIMAGISLV